jgi:hypothetical protein
MDSKHVKATFAAAGIRVRVADQGMKFRICPLRATDPEFNQAEALAVGAGLGLTSVLLEAGGQFNTTRELVGYKPGAIRRVS